DAVSLCQVLHSLDSLSLAAKLNTQAANRQMMLPVLVECNISAEPSKYGFTAWQRERWPALASELMRLAEMSNLQVRGLMTMAPIVADPEETRSYFRLLKELQQFLLGAVPNLSWNELSMGMSDDYMVAVEEGATMVRIGRAIFN
ncbi:MAG: alanine racemase, partial [Anaerolineae bacterium]